MWSDGNSAGLTLARNGATTLSIIGSSNGAAQVELELNGASVYTGPANAIAGKPFPGSARRTRWRSPCILPT